MKNKFIAGLLALAMLCTFNTSVVKADNEFTETGDQSVPVTCDITSTFTVRLPASIPLTKDGSDYKFTGNIGVKGDLSSGESIGVVTADTVKLYDMTLRPLDPLPSGDETKNEQHKASQTASVTLEKQSWLNTEINPSTFTEQALIVNAGALEAAKWKGQLTFTITGPTP